MRRQTKPSDFGDILETFKNLAYKPLKARQDKEPAGGSNWFDKEMWETPDCLLLKMQINNRTINALENPEITVCKTCFNQRRLCIRYNEDEEDFVVVPLPPVLRRDAEGNEVGPDSIGYWVFDGGKGLAGKWETKYNEGKPLWKK